MSRVRIVMACSMLALLAGSAAAQTPPAPAADAPAEFLTAAELDSSRLLPPPPAEGSVAARIELAELHAIVDARTPAELAHAQFDDKTEDASIFNAAMGPGFDLAKLPKTARLMADVKREEKAAKASAKLHFLRKRPWIVDDSFKSCSREDEPLSGYPSGHTTLGFSSAVVLADIAPTKAEALLARAADYGHSRLVCGMHFKADVVAGQALGTAVAIRLLSKPAFRAERDAAESELRTAGVIP
jgi:acid phosphatase (class A)